MGDVTANRQPVRVPSHLDLPYKGPELTEIPACQPFRLPDHLDLPDRDDLNFASFREHSQSLLLTSSILPVLRRRHPDGRFAIGQNSLIYWCVTEPYLRGSKAPDWFYVPGVPPNLDGDFRRSYVMWKEFVSPAVVLEFVSGDGGDERDRTPWKGKFWVYEQIVRAAYYGLFDIETGQLEVYHLVDGAYRRETPDARGHYCLENMDLALGVWHGHILNENAHWLRWFDANGQVLPTSEELAEIEHERAERLAERLRQLGVDPDTV